MMGEPHETVPATSDPPSRARFGVLAFLCTLALLLYVDRVCIGQAETSIRAELGLSKAEMAWVYTAFTLAYCLFEVPTGHWGDRFGSRGVIARVVLWWSAFTALTGAAFGLWSLLAFRFLFGAGEAGALPNAARVVTRWFPPQEQGKVRGAIGTAALLGAAVAPVLAALLIEAVGWRLAFAAFGAVGLVWAALFYAWFRDDPAAHPAVNAAELRLLGPGRSHPSAPDEHVRIPWGRVLASPNVWLLGAIMTVSAILFYVQFQWYPTYLKEALGQSELASGWLTAAVMTAGAAGCVAGGLLADSVTRRLRDRRWGRRLCGGGALLLAALAVLGVRLADSALAVTLCQAAALFCMQAAGPTWWTVVAEVSGRHGAAMWGLMNSLAGLGLMAVTVLIGWFVEQCERAGHPRVECWGPVFDGVAVALAVGAVCWLLVDATRSVVEPRLSAAG
jgi:MFS transporter, ACS family, glucarate transporter